MSGDNLPEMLKSVFDVSSASCIDLLRELDAPTNPTLEQIKTSLAKTLFAVPLAYTNRKGSHIFVCGMVDKGTEEYDKGSRYFSDTGCFFKADGRCFDYRQSPDDVYAVVIDEDLESKERSSLSHKWIHPYHWMQVSFFKKLTPNQTSLIPGRHYINRMGFVIHLQNVPLTKGDQLFYQDQDQTKYSTDGCISTTSSSMLDLIYEIKNWDLISQADWSSEVLPGMVHMDEDIPELFNPVSYDEKVLWSEMFESITKSQAIAKKLNINFGFQMGVPTS